MYKWLENSPRFVSPTCAPNTTETAQGNAIRADIKRHKEKINAFVSVRKHEAFGELTPLVEVRRLTDGSSMLFTAEQKYASRDGHVSVTCRCDASGTNNLLIHNRLVY
jgi:hypothetical protein